MLWKTRPIRYNLTLDLCYDFAENWTKLYDTVVDVVTNPLLLVVINWALSLIILKTRDAYCNSKHKKLITNYSASKA